MKISKEKFELIRARKCLSVKELKKRGINEGSLNSIRQHRQMRPENVGKIANILKVDVTELLEEE